MDTEIMTLDQITRLMTDDADRVERAHGRLNAARQQHAHVMSGYRADDQSDTAVGVRAEADAQLRAAEREAAETAAAVEHNTRAALRQLERAAGPTLSPEETQRAAALLEPIKEDVARFDLVAVRDALVSALTLSDRAAMSHYLRYVPMRSLEEDTGRPNEAQARAEIPALLSQMKAVLRNAAIDPHVERVRTVFDQAYALQATATQRRRESEAQDAVLRMHGGRQGVPIPSDDQLAGVVR